MDDTISTTKYDQLKLYLLPIIQKAKVVTEEEFFYKGESGGTICSSAYEKALELIDKKYHPAVIIFIHFIFPMVIIYHQTIRIVSD